MFDWFRPEEDPNTGRLKEFNFNTRKLCNKSPERKNNNHIYTQTTIFKKEIRTVKHNDFSKTILHKVCSLSNILPINSMCINEKRNILRRSRSLPNQICRINSNTNINYFSSKDHIGEY